MKEFVKELDSRLPFASKLWQGRRRVNGYTRTVYVWVKDHLKRNSFSWVFGIIIPLWFFGNKNNVQILCWKIIVVCTACVMAHIIRKQMFPYLSPGKTMELLRTTDNSEAQMIRALVFVGEAILIGLLYYAIISSMSVGL